MIRIGFSFNKANAGPSNFMKNLRKSFRINKTARTSLYFNPLNTCNIFANLPKLTWMNPYFFRLDGIIYDIMADPDQKKEANETFLNGARKSRGVIFQSEFSKKLFEKVLGYVPTVQTVIHNGTDLNVFKRGNDHHIRRQLGIEDDAFVFITSAKWRAHKRLPAILESFVNFRAKHHIPTHLIVLGDYEDLGMENVHFLQKVPNAELPLYFNAAQVYLFYSWLDPCPNSVVEAISAGLPVVCTNQGGTPELVRMSNGGIIVEADDEFPYTEINLYNPPRPDMDKIGVALEEIYTHYDSYQQNINREVFDIHLVAAQYLQFIKDNL